MHFSFIAYLSVSYCRVSLVCVFDAYFSCYKYFSCVSAKLVAYTSSVFFRPTGLNCPSQVSVHLFQLPLLQYSA